jgi:uncharacterized membrane protein YdjX (TVP38/TMEM64 family)
MSSPDRSTAARPAGSRTARAGSVPAWLRSPWLRLGLLGAMVILATVVALSADELSLGAVRETVAALGALGPLVYVGLYALVTVLLLPGTPFTILSGLLFGPVVGSVVALAGATLGATLSFLVGRVIGRGAVEQVSGRRVQAIDGFLAERGFVSMLVVRLVPLFPFNVLNLVSGVTALRFRDYVLATAIGIVPGTVLLAAAGGTVDDPGSPVFIGAVAGFVTLVIGGGVAARRMRRREKLDAA